MGFRAVEINILVDEGVEAGVEPSWLEEVAQRVLAAEKANAKTEVGIVVTGQEMVQQLNRNFRGRDEPTDVLAFSAREEGDGPSFVLAPDGLSHLGEVIIAYPQAQTQADEHGHSLKKELTILLIHGLLHLLGYDHEADKEQERRMQAREKELLKLIEGGGQ